MLHLLTLLAGFASAQYAPLYSPSSSAGFVVAGTTLNSNGYDTAFAGSGLSVGVATVTVTLKGSDPVLIGAVMTVKTSGTADTMCCRMAVDGALLPTTVNRCISVSNAWFNLSNEPMYLSGFSAGAHAFSQWCTETQTAGTSTWTNARLNVMEF